MVKSLTRSAARVYGTLSALGEGSQDILLKLMPFFDPLLRPKQGKRLDIAEFAEEVRNVYKWNFNTDIVEIFIPRLEEAGWLTPENKDINQTPYIISLPDEPAQSEQEASVMAELRGVAEKFMTFAQNLSPLTTLPKDIEEFEDILVEWLLYVEAYSEHSTEYNVATKPDGNGKLTQVVEIPSITSLKSEEVFLCARFVKEVLQTDPGISEILAKIASIGLLTEVVQDFVKPTEPINNTDLVVYLDAPVALELLGVSGKAARENTQPIISELQRIGASIRIFQASVEEMKNSLQAVLKSPQPTGPTAQAIVRREVMKDYVIKASQNPESLLEEQGIQITNRTLDKFPNEHKYCTNEMYEDIVSAQTFQTNMIAREHDSAIITFVMRQRKGRKSRDLFKSGFLIMTRNGTLAQVIRKHLLNINMISKTTIPPIIHRRVLAATMWLRTGLGAENHDVSKRLLLANCEQVLAIRPSVLEAVKKITEDIGDTEKARQLDLLIAEDRSVQMLMDKTLGAPGVVNSDNISELFQDMLHPHLEEEREKGKEQLKTVKEKQKKKLNKANIDLQEARNSESKAKSMLEVRYNEDKDIVDALCRDVEDSLEKCRFWRQVFGWFLAGISCLPLLLVDSYFVKVFSVLITVVLSYLTFTGGRLIGLETTQVKAKEALEYEAEKRRVVSKLQLFDVEWTGSGFQVKSPSQNQPSDLLPPQ